MSASKRQRVQQQQMMMNPLMMMLPQMAQMAMQQPALDEESGDEREVKEEKKEEKQEERRALPERGQVIGSGVQDKISSSVTFLRQTPRCRLSEGLEWLCKDLDPSMTHALSNTGLLALVYMCVPG